MPSGGLGYHLIKSESTSFDVFAGAAYNHLNRYDGQNFRGAELLLGEESTHKISESTTLRQKLVVYPSLKDTGEFRASFDAGITTAIIGGWNLTVTLSDRYDSKPPPNIRRNDFLVFTGLQYAWGAK